LGGFKLKLSGELNFASNRPNTIHTSPVEKKTQSETIWNMAQTTV